MKRFAVLVALAFVVAGCSPKAETTGAISNCAKDLFPAYNPKVMDQCVTACKKCDRGIALGADVRRLATSGARALVARRWESRSTSITASSAAAGGISAAADFALLAIMIARELSAAPGTFIRKSGLPDVFHF
jgi:hypothetical protein